MTADFNQSPAPARPRRRYVRAIGPRLAILLTLIFAVGGFLAANSVYLVAVHVLEQLHGRIYQNYFYQCMFLAHLAAGLLVVVPFIVFGIAHIRNAHDRPNRRAVRIGYALFAIALTLLFSGLLLVRFEPIAIRSRVWRDVFYWAHVASPLAVIWLYVLHRLAGPRIKWKAAVRWAIPAGVVIAAMVYLNSRDPRKWNISGPIEGERYFYPSLARTSSGNFIPACSLMNDQYCMECHRDNYEGWFHSAHHFSSFNNPAYLFSVRETRKVAMARDGNVRAARWCAGCHDTVPFFSGAFDDPAFDDVHDPAAGAGLSCTTCHAITHINSARGNADYTIEEPIQYPFAFSANPLLKFVNRQLIKAKPEFHKETFLKPLHKTAEFCSVCHKVSIPGELNHYKQFLRGQNHYDTFLLSGISGHNARSFYYPDQATTNCAGCHMPGKPSDDFGASAFDPSWPGILMVHDHFFPAANTAIPALRDDQPAVKAEQAFLKNAARIDLFGIKQGGTIESPVEMVRPSIPRLKPGADYLLEVVIRTLKIGHPLTQGTSDSNELWVDVNATSNSAIIGHSGGIDERKAVDPWAYFVNTYMLDRDGNRIDRRNVQDIFTPLYNHQIPPGAAAVVHYHLHVPDGQTTPITVELKLQYRKFDARFVRYFQGENANNVLPITTLASDRVTFPVDARKTDEMASPIPEWQRWNDYGIGLLLEGNLPSDRGELLQAAGAFEQVEKLGRADGPMNLARVYFKEGRLDEAAAALNRATAFPIPPPPWTANWLAGSIDQQDGNLDRAIAELQSVVESRWPDAQRRGFDFSKDYEVLNTLGQTLFDRAKREPANSTSRQAFLFQARDRFEQTLAIDSENLTAHYVLSQIDDELSDHAGAEMHRAAHARYRPDDNARDRAVALARQRDKASDHAAGAVVIYELETSAPRPR